MSDTVRIQKAEFVAAPEYGRATLVVHERVHMEMQAKLAFELMGRLAIIAAQEDGEDSAGRQKLRLMTPTEVAARACDIAAAACNEFVERDWLSEVQPWADIQAELDDKRKRN
jgi:hypothetical protein